MKIKYPLLIDGGLSNELENQGCNLDHKLWSAKMLVSNPEAIIKAHLKYLEAGAQCLITSSYQASIEGFITLGYDRNEAETFISQTVKLAEIAIDRFNNYQSNNFNHLIAASIGPYGAFLADGSEYHGNYGVSDETLKEFHKTRIQLLDLSNADFFACETIPSYQEAKVLGELLNDTNKSAWISFSCKDEKHLNDGTPIGECTSFFAKHPNVFAIGVNCTAPKYISRLIKAIKAKSGEKKIVIYPNSGEIYIAKNKTWIGFIRP